MTRSPLRNSALVTVAAAVVIGVTGCGDSGSDTTDAASSSAAPSSSAPAQTTGIAAPSPAFEGLDPCSMLTGAEIEQMTGVPNLTAAQQPGLKDGDISCRWGDVEPGVDVDFGTILRPEEISSTNDRARTLSRQFGRTIDMEAYDGKSCYLAAVYSENRAVMFTVNPGAAAVAAHPVTENDDICQRALPAISTVLNERITWK